MWLEKSRYFSVFCQCSMYISMICIFTEIAKKTTKKVSLSSSFYHIVVSLNVSYFVRFFSCCSSTLHCYFALSVFITLLFHVFLLPLAESEVTHLPRFEEEGRSCCIKGFFFKFFFHWLLFCTNSAKDASS